MGEDWEGEAASRWETVIARFRPPPTLPSLTEGNEALLRSSRGAMAIADTCRLPPSSAKWRRMSIASHPLLALARRVGPAAAAIGLCALAAWSLYRVAQKVSPGEIWTALAAVPH